MARRSVGMGGLGRTAYNRLPMSTNMAGLGDAMDDVVGGGDLLLSDGSYPQASQGWYLDGNGELANRYADTALNQAPMGNGAIVNTPFTAGPGTTAYPGGSSLDTAKQMLQQLPTLAQSAIGIQNMQRLQQLNQALVLQGKPPLTAAQMTAMQTPLSFGLQPQTMNMLLIGGALLAVVMLAGKRGGGNGGGTVIYK